MKKADMYEDIVIWANAMKALVGKISLYIPEQDCLKYISHNDLRVARSWLKFIYYNQYMTAYSYYEQRPEEYWASLEVMGYAEMMPEYVKLEKLKEQLRGALRTTTKPDLFYKTRTEPRLKRLKKADENN